jgi:hypothetical protein
MMRRMRAKSCEPSPDIVDCNSRLRAALPGLDSQALTALGAACVQDTTATTGSHTCAEAVRALATDDGRLVSTFHGGLAKAK